MVLADLRVSQPSSDLGGGKYIVSCMVSNRKFDGQPQNFRQLSRSHLRAAHSGSFNGPDDKFFGDSPDN